MKAAIKEHDAPAFKRGKGVHKLIPTSPASSKRRKIMSPSSPRSIRSRKRASVLSKKPPSPSLNYPKRLMSPNMSSDSFGTESSDLSRRRTVMLDDTPRISMFKVKKGRKASLPAMEKKIQLRIRRMALD